MTEEEIRQMAIDLDIDPSDLGLIRETIKARKDTKLKMASSEITYNPHASNKE